jgi:hypothetical protein
MSRPRHIAAVVAGLLIGSLALPSASARSEMFCAPASDFFPDADTVLHGDVDGDGTADTVSTRGRISPDGSCRARLVVETDRGIYRTKVAPLTGLLLVPPWLGASTGFLDMYGLHGRQLQRLSPQAFSYAGSFGQPSGVDCIHHRGARLVASTASIDRRGRHYIGERDFYSVGGGSLRLLPRLTERFRIPIDAIDRIPELASLVPFPSCTVVRGAS